MVRIFASGIGVAVLAGCSQLPVQKAELAGGIYDLGAAEFAVFAEDGRATAVRMGTLGSDDPVQVLAVRAIERATGCQVVSGSTAGDDKTVEAAIQCAQMRPIAVAMGQKPDG